MLLINQVKYDLSQLQDTCIMMQRPVFHFLFPSWLVPPVDQYGRGQPNLVFYQ